MAKNQRISLFAGIVIGGLVVAGWWFWQQKDLPTEDISSRTQQFMTEHGDMIGSGEVSFGDNGEYKTDLAIDGTCFSLISPFKTKSARAEEPAASCTVRFDTQEPISHVAVTTKKSAEKLTDDPGIAMRRKTDSGYTEKVLNSQKYGEILRFDNTDAVTIFFQISNQKITIGFTGLADTAKVDDVRLLKLIDSLVINTKPTLIKTYEATDSATASEAAAGF